LPRRDSFEAFIVVVFSIHLSALTSDRRTRRRIAGRSMNARWRHFRPQHKALQLVGGGPRDPRLVAAILPGTRCISIGYAAYQQQVTWGKVISVDSIRTASG